MNIMIVDAGYVSLVTGTCFSEIGNNVVYADLDSSKIEARKKGIMPIYELELQERGLRNAEAECLHERQDCRDRRNIYSK